MSPKRRSIAIVLAGLAAVSFSVTGTSAAFAGGKPANGSVGNADDKAPKGQSANDKNAGYECDRNRGIGRGNPAHSGCATTTTEAPTTTTEAPTTTTEAPTTTTTWEEEGF